MRLKGRIAIITGGGSGIGHATAKVFAAEGAIVVVADKNLAAAKAVAVEIADGASAVEVDVARSASVKALVDGTVARHGRIDILFNNAGYGITGNVVETSEEDWNALMAVNINGVFFGCKHAIPHMIRQGGGAIVNTASTTSRVGIKDRAAYVTSKGAVAAMTRAMALDHVEHNIRVNCVAPGTIESPYFAKIFAESARSQGPARRTRGAPADDAARPAGGDRQGGAVPRQRRRLVLHRHYAVRGWRLDGALAS